MLYSSEEEVKVLSPRKAIGSAAAARASRVTTEKIVVVNIDDDSGSETTHDGADGSVRAVQSESGEAGPAVKREVEVQSEYAATMVVKRDVEVKHEHEESKVNCQDDVVGGAAVAMKREVKVEVKRDDGAKAAPRAPTPKKRVVGRRRVQVEDESDSDTEDGVVPNTSEEESAPKKTGKNAKHRASAAFAAATAAIDSLDSDSEVGDDTPVQVTKKATRGKTPVHVTKPTASVASRKKAAASDHDDDDDDDDESVVAMDTAGDYDGDREDEEDAMDVSGVFSTYRPPKLRIGRPHPGRVVETSVLARATPPDITYELHPRMQPVIDSGKLSSLQLESIVYTSMQHEATVNGDQTAGFFVGDGAGVGKGRTIAGLMLENWLRGRKKHLWFSVSNDLYHDAKRDLDEIGAQHIPTMSLGDIGYDMNALRKFKEGILFCTYATARGKSKAERGQTRVSMIVNWAGGDEFNGCMVFDEGHKAKKLVAEEGDKKNGKKPKSTQTALSVQDLHNLLPKARVTYVSATGASELNNLSYMSRLGLWGRENGSLFETMNQFFSNSAFKGSIGALELISMNLKSLGKYAARTLSFADCTFRIDNVPAQEDFQMTYDSAVDVWYELLQVMDMAWKDTMITGTASFTNPVQQMDLPKTFKMFKSQYWGGHQRFFKHLIIASKISYVVELSKKALEDGNCVVIGLLSTGEAAATRYAESKNIATAASSASSSKSSKKKASAPVEYTATGRPCRGASAASVSYAEQNSDDDDTQDEESDDESTTSASTGGKGKKRLKKSTAGGKKGRKKPAAKGKASKKRGRGDTDSDDDDDDSEFDPDEPTSDNGGVPRKAAHDDDDESDVDDGYDDDEEEDVGRQRGRGAARPDAVEGEETDEEEDTFVGIEATLRDIIKKFVPDAGSGTDENGTQFLYRDRRKELLGRVRTLELPQFPLDNLIKELGGPKKVAEITGRKMRLDITKNGDYVQVRRAAELGCAAKDVNRLEAKAFNSGKKLVCLISEAGSTGISLHADRRFKNQRRRVHITLELPFNSSQLVQQLGRSHRSNQSSGPEYVCAVSGLPGEVRFASTAAQRLAQLGAITQGDRMACLGSGELQEYDLDTKWGKKALKVLFGYIKEEGAAIQQCYMPESIQSAEDPDAAALEFQRRLQSNLALVDLAKVKEGGRQGGANARGRRVRARGVFGGANNHADSDDDGGGNTYGPAQGVDVTKFFNRLLALTVENQFEVFEFFETIHAQIVAEAKTNGKHDSGVVDLYMETCLSVDRKELLRSEGFPLVLHSIKWDRGFTFDKALALREEWLAQMREARGEEDNDEMDDGTGTGFYVQPGTDGMSKTVTLALELTTSAFAARNSSARMRAVRKYKMVSPNGGHKGHGSSLNKDVLLLGSELHRNNRQKETDMSKVRAIWEKQYNMALKNCIHVCQGQRPRTVQDPNGRVRELVGARDCWLNPNHEMHRRFHGNFCPIGRREGASHVLTGNVLKVWPLLQEALGYGDNKEHIQIVRCVSDGGAKLVGVDVRANRKDGLEQKIAEFRADMGMMDDDEEQAVNVDAQAIATWQQNKAEQAAEAARQREAALQAQRQAQLEQLRRQAARNSTGGGGAATLPADLQNMINSGNIDSATLAAAAALLAGAPGAGALSRKARHSRTKKTRRRQRFSRAILPPLPPAAAPAPFPMPGAAPPPRAIPRVAVPSAPLSPPPRRSAGAMAAQAALQRQQAAASMVNSDSDF